jgi:hypothetical protein
MTPEKVGLKIVRENLFTRKKNSNFVVQKVKDDGTD